MKKSKKTLQDLKLMPALKSLARDAKEKIKGGGGLCIIGIITD